MDIDIIKWLYCGSQNIFTMEFHKVIIGIFLPWNFTKELYDYFYHGILQRNFRNILTLEIYKVSIGIFLPWNFTK